MKVYKIGDSVIVTHKEEQKEGTIVRIVPDIVRPEGEIYYVIEIRDEEGKLIKIKRDQNRLQNENAEGKLKKFLK